MNLLDLFYDAGNALRFRYKPAEAYRYGWGVFAAVMLAVGCVQAADLSVLLGHGNAVLAFGVVVALVRWLVLTRVMTALMHHYGSPRIPFLGYTLMTEALVLPGLLAFYLPPDWMGLVMMWNVWTFWAQAAGFMQISGQSGMKVLFGYVLYFVVSVLLVGVIFGLFAAAGWLDAEQLLKNWQQMQQMQP